MYLLCRPKTASLIMSASEDQTESSVGKMCSFELLTPGFSRKKQTAGHESHLMGPNGRTRLPTFPALCWRDHQDTCPRTPFRAIFVTQIEKQRNTSARIHCHPSSGLSSFNEETQSTLEQVSSRHGYNLVNSFAYIKICPRANSRKS